MHRTTDNFWRCYHALPQEVRGRADKAFELLRNNPKHPSLHFKKIGTFWSARIDLTHRVLAIEDSDDFIWVWVGTHDEYERLIQGR
jgi:hypothetical protein